MLNPSRLLLFIWIVGAITGCAERPDDSGHFELNSLIGTWEFHHEGTHEIAEWHSDGRGGLTGNGFVVDAGDTTFIEFLTIEKADSSLVYYAAASPGESEERVPFYLASQTDRSIEFFNGNYGFPQRIVYTLTSDTTIFAYIEGPQDAGRIVRINFNYQKRRQ